MRILIFGAGAVGGYLGGILTVAGADVTLVARGPHYDAMTGRGLVLEGKKSGRPEPIRVRACRPREEKPPYDLIFVGLKSHQIAGNAAHLAKLLAPDGMIILAQNGIPYWYFEKIDRGSLRRCELRGHRARHGAGRDQSVFDLIESLHLDDSGDQHHENEPVNSER